MAKGIKAAQQRIEEEIARLERELDDMGDLASEADRASVNELRVRISETGRELKRNEKTLALLRAACLRDRPSFEAMTVEMPKWRTTILLAINSAAMVAVMGQTELAREALVTATLFFLTGALAALSSGSVLEHVGRSGLELADELGAANLDDPDYSTDDLDRALKASNRLTHASIWADALRFLSLCFFAGGVLWSVFSTP